MKKMINRIQKVTKICQKESQLIYNSWTTKTIWVQEIIWAFETTGLALICHHCQKLLKVSKEVIHRSLGKNIWRSKLSLKMSSIGVYVGWEAKVHPIRDQLKIRFLWGPPYQFQLTGPFHIAKYKEEKATIRISVI